MKYSVIITVYNAPEMYLRECVDSVLGQTYSEVEILLVDDGSNNAETLRVLDEYDGKSDYNGKTLIVHHKENGGQGSARNAGLAIASGDYILFLDNDDYYLSINFLDDISKLLIESKADLLSFQYAEFFDEQKRPMFCKGNLHREKVFNQSADVAIKALLSAQRSSFSAATHTKAIKATFLREHNITAIESLSNEDISLTAMIIRHAKIFDRYDYAVYAFRRSNTGSISTNEDNSFKIAHDILKQFQSLLSDKVYRNNRNILDFLASPYIYWLGKMVSASVSARKTQQEAIRADIRLGKEYSYVLKYSSRPYVRLAGLFLRVFGIRFTMFLMKIYLTLNRKHLLSLKRRVKS